MYRRRERKRNRRRRVCTISQRFCLSIVLIVKESSSYQRTDWVRVNPIQLLLVLVLVLVTTSHHICSTFANHF
jgi:hypothetical protein